MLPATNKAGGQCMAFPDVCKTPTPGGPVPVPYPNIGMVPQVNGGTCTSKVKIQNQKVLTKNSKITMSSGDEAGSVGGVVSNKIKGEVVYKKGSSKVKMEGKPAAHLTSMTGHNGTNANMPAGAQIAPSQVKVLVAL
ncbi:DUF4150 domain-containing protein [Ectothiorhodospiraceae bacterium WFHF3C12]|nr:DUF4150 domain-containing protein [Ectothiorhodospiraceae bacterium WFHF3C12]